MFDNKLFSVNGRTFTMLADAIKLVFAQRGDHTKAVAWKMTPDHGLIIFWHHDPQHPNGATPFPTAMDAEQVLPTVVGFLETYRKGKPYELAQLPVIKHQQWEAYGDHDGSNEAGWRVFVEDWGHVGDSSSAICAIKPVALWLGK